VSPVLADETLRCAICGDSAGRITVFTERIKSKSLTVPKHRPVHPADPSPRRADTRLRGAVAQLGERRVRLHSCLGPSGLTTRLVQMGNFCATFSLTTQDIGC